MPRPRRSPGQGRWALEHSRKTMLPIGRVWWSGADRSRTDDLLNAIQALSQLSYGPSTTLDFQSALSGADGTRTRGLRCDRPAL